MIRIMICAGTSSGAEAIHRKAQGILRAAKIRCELSFSSSPTLMMNEQYIRTSDYDVYVLDACSKECLALAAHIRKNNALSSILFLNVQRDCALNRIIKYRPSYLVFSPEGDDNLGDGLKRCCAEQTEMCPYFTVRTKDSDMRIGYKDIMLFESAQRIVRIYTVSNVVEFYAKLGDIAQRLPADRFVRCHQSYVLNMSCIRKLDKSARYFHLISGKEIPISKSCYTEAVERYERFSSGSLLFE